MNNTELSAKILALIGGRENVSGVTHCITRLRVVVKDTSVIKREQITKLSGVMGDNLVGTQYQIILGPKVADVFKEFQPLVGVTAAAEGPKEKTKISSVIIDTLTGVFVPIIPAMIGAGLIKGILLFLMFANLVDTSTDAYRLLSVFSDAIYYFLPILLACSTAEYFKCNKYIAMAIAGILVHPDLIALLAGENVVKFLGITVTKASYSSTVIPIILSILFMVYVERFLAKYIPKILRTIAVPLLTILITAPVTLWVLGPIGSIISNVIASNFLSFYMSFGPIAGTLFSGLFPALVLLGIHNGFTPVMIQSISTYGVEYLMGLNVASNSAQAGATFAVFCRTRNPEFKQVAGSCAFSAFLGITEPALYGVTAKLKRPLFAVMAGGAVGGAIAGFFHVTATGMGTGPIIGIPLFFTDTFIYFVISCVISAVVAFALTFVLGFEDVPAEDVESAEPEVITFSVAENVVAAPLSGECSPLSECKDDVFGSGTLGDGVIIEPVEGKVYAPCDGEISNLADTLHAIGITAASGAELLIHVGMDTVTLNGEGFKSHIQTGDKIKAGQLLLEFDMDFIRSKGLPLTTPVVVTDSDERPNMSIQTGTVKVGDTIITL